MADEMVLRAQRWINSYGVNGTPKVEENGRTSWAVMYALTRILQHALGIGTLSDNFGPTTLSELERQYAVIDEKCRNAAIVRVVQAGLYCKGYNCGEIDGVFEARTSTGTTTLKQNMGLSGVWPGAGMTPKAMKALLTMDAYVRVGSGIDTVRSVQQWLNSRYILRRNFFAIPCDGNFSRDVQKALMLAIQFELGMSDDVANGVFGPGTRAGLRNNILGTGATGVWVQLFTAAMLFNQRPGIALFSDLQPRSSRSSSRLPVLHRTSTHRPGRLPDVGFALGLDRGRYASRHSLRLHHDDHPGSGASALRTGVPDRGSVPVQRNVWHLQ